MYLYKYFLKILKKQKFNKTTTNEKCFNLILNLISISKLNQKSENIMLVLSHKNRSEYSPYLSHIYTHVLQNTRRYIMTCQLADGSIFLCRFLHFFYITKSWRTTAIVCFIHPYYIELFIFGATGLSRRHGVWWWCTQWNVSLCLYKVSCQSTCFQFISVSLEMFLFWYVVEHLSANGKRLFLSQ